MITLAQDCAEVPFAVLLVAVRAVVESKLVRRHKCPKGVFADYVPPYGSYWRLRLEERTHEAYGCMATQQEVPYVRINTATPQHLVNKAFHRKTLHV